VHVTGKVTKSLHEPSALLMVAVIDCVPASVHVYCVESAEVSAKVPAVADHFSDVGLPSGSLATAETLMIPKTGAVSGAAASELTSGQRSKVLAR